MYKYFFLIVCMSLAAKAQVRLPDIDSAIPDVSGVADNLQSGSTPFVQAVTADPNDVYLQQVQWYMDQQNNILERLRLAQQQAESRGATISPPEPQTNLPIEESQGQEESRITVPSPPEPQTNHPVQNVNEPQEESRNAAVPSPPAPQTNQPAEDVSQRQAPVPVPLPVPGVSATATGSASEPAPSATQMPPSVPSVTNPPAPPGSTRPTPMPTGQSSMSSFSFSSSPATAVTSTSTYVPLPTFSAGSHIMMNHDICVLALFLCVLILL